MADRPSHVGTDGSQEWTIHYSIEDGRVRMSACGISTDLGSEEEWEFHDMGIHPRGAPSLKRWLDVYGSVSKCRRCRQGVICDHQAGHIPRGYYSAVWPGDPIDLMLVAQNPAKPKKDEADRYRGFGPNRQALAHRSFAGDYFQDESSVFHRRIVAWLTFLYPDEFPFRRVVYTNLVKCTTEGNKVPDSGVTDTCVGAHLWEEINLWNPSRIVALGDAVFLALGKQGIPALYLPHPTHRKGNDYAKPFLERVKAQLES